MLLPDILEKKKDLTDLLFYACFNREEIKDPIYVNGDEKKIFDFLNKLFHFLPKRVWWSISYNTFWYKEPLLPGTFFCCTDFKSCEIRPPSYSLKIDLEKQEYESKIYIKNEIKDEHAKYVSQKALTDKQSLSCFYSQEELVMSRDWEKFIASYKDSPQDNKEIVYKYHKEDFLKEVSQGNNTLLSAILKDINRDDRNRIYKSNTLIQRIIEYRDEILANDFVEWFYDFHADDKRELYTIFLNNLWLFELLIAKITEKNVKVSKNIEIIQTLIENIPDHEGRNDVIEVRLLEVLCESFENITDIDIDMPKILKVIKKLPSSGNPKILILRALIKYELGDNSELVSLIKEDTCQLLICDILNKGMKIIDFEKYKSLQRKKSKSFLFMKI